MNDSQSNFPSIAKLLRPHFISAIAILIIALVSLFLAKLAENKQSQYLADNQLPEISSQLAFLQDKSTLSKLIQLQLNAPLAEVVTNHQALLGHLDNSSFSSPVFEKLGSFPAYDLERIANNGVRNAQLASNAKSLIGNTRVSTDKVVSELAAQINETEQLLVGTLSVDGLTQGRLVSLGQLKSALLLLTQINYSLSILDIKLATLSKPAINLQVEDIKAVVNQLVQYHSVLNSTSLKQESQTLLLRQLNQISDLFLTGEALLGKWQGTTKLYQTYISLVADVNEQLNGTNLTPNTNAQHSMGITFGSVVVTWAELSIGLAIFSLIFTVLGFALLVKVFKRFSKESRQLVDVVKEQIVAGKSTPSNYEQQHVVAIVEQALSGAVTHADVEQLKQKNATAWTNLAQSAHLCGWQIDNGKINFTCDEFIAALVGAENNADLPSNMFFWRTQLGRSAAKHLIAAAKQAKSNNDFHHLDTSINNNPLRITIGCKNGQWLGTVKDCTTESELKAQVEALELQLAEQRHQALSNIMHDHEVLSRVVVQAMLQCQNAAVVSGYNSQPVYRQLERVLDWLRQQQIVAQLASQGARKYTDINIRQTLYALFNNVVSEAQLKHHQVYLLLDEKLVDAVKVNVRLFNRLITGFCRRLLKEQFKSELTVKVDVVDQNSGQQLIKISGRVPHQKGKASENLLRFSHGEALPDKTRSEQYLFALLGALHADNLTASQVEHGVEVSFTLPLTLPAKVASALTDTRLAQQHLLVICGTKAHRKLIAHYLSSAKAQCETLSKVDLFSKDYNLAAINKRKLDAVVVTSDMAADLAMIMQHIESLPESKRPSLVVLQNNHCNLATTGLYSLSDVPICQHSLIDEVEQAIANKQRDNLLASAQHYATWQFVPTQVELLLAVENVEAYQPLWRTLNWLGFKVTVVADSTSMIKRWQTGRYLILMKEFDVSPFVELLAGKSIARGVFDFSEAEVIELDEKQVQMAKHWHFGKVPTFEQIDDLVKLLSPWLKEQNTSVHSAQHANIHTENPTRVDTGQPAPLAQTAKITETVKGQNTPPIEPDSAADFCSSIGEELPPAFDMEQYAKNQGSPELAVFMLDDYLDTLTDNVQEFSLLITDKADEAISEKIGEINLIASILAAPAMLQLGQQLEQALLNNAYENMQRLLEQVKYEIGVIKSFADAI